MVWVQWACDEGRLSRSKRERVWFSGCGTEKERIERRERGREYERWLRGREKEREEIGLGF